MGHVPIFDSQTNTAAARAAQRWCDALHQAARTIDRYGTPGVERLSSCERAQLLRWKDGFEPGQASCLAGGALIPGYRTEDGTSVGPEPETLLWAAKSDAAFRQKLLERSPSAGGTASCEGPASSLQAPSSERRAASGRRFAVVLVDAEYDRSAAEGRWFAEENAAAELENMKRVLAEANARGLPVIEMVWPKKYETDPALAALRRPGNWTRVEKVEQDGFAKNNLTETLKAAGVTDVLLMGLYQEACVKETAKGALGAGLRVHTSADLVQSLGSIVTVPGIISGEPFKGWSDLPGAHVVSGTSEAVELLDE